MSPEEVSRVFAELPSEGQHRVARAAALAFQTVRGYAPEVDAVVARNVAQELACIAEGGLRIVGRG